MRCPTCGQEGYEPPAAPRYPLWFTIGIGLLYFVVLVGGPECFAWAARAEPSWGFTGDMVVSARVVETLAVIVFVFVIVPLSIRDWKRERNL